MCDSTRDAGQSVPLEQLAERERDVARARAELRAERAKVAADRAEADRLLAEAHAAVRDAERERKLARKAAARFARHLEHTNSKLRGLLEADAANLAADRKRLDAEVARFAAVRTEFHAAAAAARDRLRETWAGVEADRRRAAGEWAEADRYFSEQTAALDARSADLERREQEAAGRLAKAEAEAAGLQEESAALDQRVHNARAVLAELERRREQARAELLGNELPAPLVPAGSGADDFAQRELLLQREKAAVATLRAALERESADLDDRRRLVAEQLAQLADARARWQRAERQTVVEMEELARALRQREADLDERERRLIRADARRREEAHALWRLRLRLEAWQGKLTTLELRSHAEREQLAADLARRAAVVLRRESALGAVFAKWEQARAADHARLRAELEHWADDRRRMERAAAEFDRARREQLAELAAHAARALAAEQLVAEAVQDAGSEYVTRRLRVLRKRWGRLFDRHAKELDARRAGFAAERVALEDRYRELHVRLAELVGREGAESDRLASAEFAALVETLRDFPPAPRTDLPPAPSPELAALRAEVERLAVVMMEAEVPEPLAAAEQTVSNPTAPTAGQTPPPKVLPFGGNDSRAA